MRFYYLIGQPGAGKTTLLATLLAGAVPDPHSQPVPHLAYYDRVGSILGAEIGKRRDTFAGTDALALGVQPKAVAWVHTQPFDLLIAEGDRLANDGFFKAVEGAGYTLTVLWLDTPDAEAQRRRDARGSRQNPTWVKGRVSKVAGLAQRWPVVRLDGTRPTAELAQECWQMQGLDRFRRQP